MAGAFCCCAASGDATASAITARAIEPLMRRPADGSSEKCDMVVTWRRREDSDRSATFEHVEGARRDDIAMKTGDDIAVAKRPDEVLPHGGVPRVRRAR